jgi:hypothetical protein
MGSPSAQTYPHSFRLCVLCVRRLGNCSAFNPFGALAMEDLRLLGPQDLFETAQLRASCALDARKALLSL